MCWGSPGSAPARRSRGLPAWQHGRVSAQTPSNLLTSADPELLEPALPSRLAGSNMFGKGSEMPDIPFASAGHATAESRFAAAADRSDTLADSRQIAGLAPQPALQGAAADGSNTLHAADERWAWHGSWQGRTSDHIIAGGCGLGVRGEGVLGAHGLWCASCSRACGQPNNGLLASQHLVLHKDDHGISLRDKQAGDAATWYSAH